jgi:hypothetical protein
MKKLPLIAFALLLSFAAQSQVRFGVSLDPQIAWLSSDLKRIESNGTVGGLNVGLNMDTFFSRNHAFYTGFFIETTGGNLKYRDGITLHSKDTPNFKVASNGNVKYRTQYITIPTGIKLRTNPMGYNTLYAIMGLRTSFKLKTKGYTEDGLASNMNGPEMDGEVLENTTYWINLGYQLGIGTEYSLGGNVSLIFGLTYNNGITNTMDNSGAHINQNNVSLKLGVMF